MDLAPHEQSSGWKEILVTPIRDKAHIELVLSQVIKGVYAIAIIQFIVAMLLVVLESDIFYAFAATMDGVLYILLAYLTKRFHSRVAASLLAVLALITVLGSFQSISILFAVLLFWFSVRAAQCVFVFHKK